MLRFLHVAGCLYSASGVARDHGGLRGFVVGQKYESMAASGAWYPVTVTAANDDGTYDLDVNDGYGTKWRHQFDSYIRSLEPVDTGQDVKPPSPVTPPPMTQALRASSQAMLQAPPQLQFATPPPMAQAWTQGPFPAQWAWPQVPPQTWPGWPQAAYQALFGGPQWGPPQGPPLVWPQPPPQSPWASVQAPTLAWPPQAAPQAFFAPAPVPPPSPPLFTPVLQAQPAPAPASPRTPQQVQRPQRESPLVAPPRAGSKATSKVTLQVTAPAMPSPSQVLQMPSPGAQEPFQSELPQQEPAPQGSASPSGALGSELDEDLDPLASLEAASAEVSAITSESALPSSVPSSSVASEVPSNSASVDDVVEFTTDGAEEPRPARAPVSLEEPVAAQSLSAWAPAAEQHQVPARPPEGVTGQRKSRRTPTVQLAAPPQAPSAAAVPPQVPSFDVESPDAPPILQAPSVAEVPPQAPSVAMGTPGAAPISQFPSAAAVLQLAPSVAVETPGATPISPQFPNVVAVPPQAPSSAVETPGAAPVPQFPSYAAVPPQPVEIPAILQAPSVAAAPHQAPSVAVETLGAAPMILPVQETAPIAVNGDQLPEPANTPRVLVAVRSHPGNRDTRKWLRYSFHRALPPPSEYLLKFVICRNGDMDPLSGTLRAEAVVSHDLILLDCKAEETPAHTAVQLKLLAEFAAKYTKKQLLVQVADSSFVAWRQVQRVFGGRYPAELENALISTSPLRGEASGDSLICIGRLLVNRILALPPDLQLDALPWAALPASESGYQAAVAWHSTSSMRRLVLRTLNAMGRTVERGRQGDLEGLLPWYDGRSAVQSLSALQAELARVPWTLDLATAGGQTLEPPAPLDLSAVSRLVASASALDVVCRATLADMNVLVLDPNVMSLDMKCLVELDQSGASGGRFAPCIPGCRSAV